MNPRVSIATAAASTMLAGCCCLSPPDRTGGPGKTPVAGQCAQANTKAATCEPKGNKLICPVYVYNTPDGTVVFPYRLLVPAREKAIIVWHLAEPKNRFEANDGPLELKTNGEFEEGGPTDDPDGGSLAARGKKFKIHYKNTVPVTAHSYTIKFRNQSGTEFKCDPIITNESG